MTMEDFRAGVSKIRNRVIALVFRELGFMEEWGSGYKRVMAACQSGGYPAPGWNELGAAFRVIFFPHPRVMSHLRSDVPVNVPANVPISERQRWFIDQLGAEKKVKASDLATHWNVVEKTARRDISELKRQGMIEFVGPKKRGRIDSRSRERNDWGCPG